jgi:hypothetical protein
LGTLDVLESNAGGRVPGDATRLTLGASFAHPDSSWPLEGLALVRDDSGSVADGFDASRLTLAVRGANVVRPLARVAAGLFSFAVAAEPGSGGRSLTIELRFDGQTLVERSVPIAVDPALAQARPSARGGCTLGHGRPRPPWGIVVALAWIALVRRRRPRHS